jgi:Fe-S-cluster containining protein
MLITDLDAMRALAAARHAEFEQMREALEFDPALDDDALDALIDDIARPIVAAIDCTQCADEDLGAAQGEWAVIPEKPCPFLRGKLCSIYAHRPHACRLYPQFTPDFRYNLEDTIEGASYCPIIYNVVSALADRTQPLPWIEP